MKRLRVLVFPGGTEIGLEIHRSLSLCKEIQLFSAGLDVSNHAPFVFERHFVLPSIHERHWVDSLNEILIREKIDYIFPAYDDIIVALAQNQQKIVSRTVSSPLETCLITRSKTSTYNHLRGIVPVPEQFEAKEEVSSYPVFMKPDKGQGAQGTVLIANSKQLQTELENNPGDIIMEYLPGKEYTVDCFSDREQGLLYCSGRQRVRIRDGISVASRLVDCELFGEYAKKISTKLSLHGAWFFQVKEDKYGELKLLEIAPRIAGTMALHRVQGINFPLLSIFEQERYPIEIMANPNHVEIDRALINRYRHNVQFEAVYVDLDDTLILDGKINIPVLSFLFQCINEGKKIILLTKHVGNLSGTLENYRLSQIFDEIIHISSDASKSDHIREASAIFIDDSFKERKEVYEQRGILTFDSSMLEMLINDRR